jgi:hypothetical protein
MDFLAFLFCLGCIQLLLSILPNSGQPSGFLETHDLKTCSMCQLQFVQSRGSSSFRAKGKELHIRRAQRLNELRFRQHCDSQRGFSHSLHIGRKPVAGLWSRWRRDTLAVDSGCGSDAAPPASGLGRLNRPLGLPRRRCRHVSDGAGVDNDPLAFLDVVPPVFHGGREEEKVARAMPLGPLTPCRAPLRRRNKGTPGERTAFSFTIPSALDAT